MTRREALQVLTTAPAWQFDMQTSLVVHMNWKTVTVVRGSERIEIDPQELFNALKEPKP